MISSLKSVTDLADKYNGVKQLAIQPLYARRKPAMSAMGELSDNVQQRDDIAWNINDATALGAIQAIEAAGRAGITVSGFDGTLEGIKAVLDGKLAYTLDQSPFQQGAFSVRAAVDVLNGVEIEEEIKTGGTVIDMSNAQAILDEFYGD